MLNKFIFGESEPFHEENKENFSFISFLVYPSSPYLSDSIPVTFKKRILKKISVNQNADFQMLSLRDSEMCSYRLEKFALLYKFMYERIQKSAFKNNKDPENDNLTFSTQQAMDTWRK